MKKLITLFAAVGVLIAGCKKENSSDNTTTTTTSSTSTTSSSNNLALYQKIYGATSVVQDGDYVVIKTTCLPDHKSPYYQGTQWETDKYEAYNGTNTSWNQNPNKIVQSNLTFRIPLHPAVNSTHASTPLGAIGISLNAIPMYNQYAGPSQPLTGEINSFDQYNGHPQQQGQYHYHVEPLYLTTNKGKDAMLGFLLDGFPVYGPEENGQTLISSDLDVYHGHEHATAEFPNGIYHYHFTADAPYLNGSGFYGTAGTVTQ